MATLPIYQQAPPAYPRYGRSLPTSLHTRSRSSSMESRARGRSYTRRAMSIDSLDAPTNNSSDLIQRWDGNAREATEWNSLRHDPELFLPAGNCLIYLFGAGSSRRGPSFRVPYDLLLYSGCRPLTEQCLMASLSVSPYHPASSTPPSYDAVDYPMSNEENCSYLYLQAPVDLPREDAHTYHLTTRNFFAWLLGVPLVGTDPVSALLDLKVRMDMWRDPGSSNFGALFDYVKEQGYGDFEALEIEMGRRLNGDIGTGPATTGFAPNPSTLAREPSIQQSEGKVSRGSSLTQRLRRKLSRSRVSSPEIRNIESAPSLPEPAQPARVAQRVQTLRLSSYNREPSAPTTDDMYTFSNRLSEPSIRQFAPATQDRYAALRDLSSHSSTRSDIDVTSAYPRRANQQELQRRVSRANVYNGHSVGVRGTQSAVDLPPQPEPQMRRVLPQSSAIGQVSSSAATEQASVPMSATSITPVEKKMRHRLSWASLSGRKRPTEASVPPLPVLQTPQTRPAAPSTIYQQTGSPSFTASMFSISAAPALPAEEKKHHRLSWNGIRGRTASRRATETEMSGPPRSTAHAPSQSLSAIDKPADSSSTIPAVPSAVSVNVAEKKKKRFSWASIRGKSTERSPATQTDAVVPALPKSNIEPVSPKRIDPPTSTSAAPLSVVGGPSRPTTTASSSSYISRSTPTEGRSRRSSYHPSVRDPKTGDEVCACCGKRRQPRQKPRDVNTGSSSSPSVMTRPESTAGRLSSTSVTSRPGSTAGPSSPSSTKARTRSMATSESSSSAPVKTGPKQTEAGKEAAMKHKMSNRRKDFKSKLHKEIIVPAYGNGIVHGKPNKITRGTAVGTAAVSKLDTRLSLSSHHDTAAVISPTAPVPELDASPSSPESITFGQSAYHAATLPTADADLRPQIVDPDIVTDIESLMGELESAGIGEKGKGKANRGGVASMDERLGLVRDVRGVVV